MKRILIIEDSKVLQKMFDKLISKNGSHPTIVETAEEGLELLKNKVFDAIITDCNLPGKSGIDFIKMIHGSKLHCNIPIVFSTPDPLDASEVVDMIDSFLIKPFKPNDIKELIEFLFSSQNS